MSYETLCFFFSENVHIYKTFLNVLRRLTSGLYVKFMHELAASFQPQENPLNLNLFAEENFSTIIEVWGTFFSYFND